MSTTTMARANNISNADELRSQIRAMIVPDWVSIPAIALAVPVAPAELSKWLAGNPLEADLNRFEREISKFLKSRGAWLAEIKSADPERRRAMRLAKAVEVRELGAKLAEEPSRTAYGDVLQECIAFGVYDLFLLSEEGEAASCYRCGEPRSNASLPKTPTQPERCWRCDAEQGPLTRSIEEEIEVNLRVAEWSGWQPETFRLKARMELSEGDRIIKFALRRFYIRKPDKSVKEVTLLDG
jgi:hypothetical protein